MTCNICGRYSFGNDICPDCEDKLREARHILEQMDEDHLEIGSEEELDRMRD